MVFNWVIIDKICYYWVYIYNCKFECRVFYNWKRSMEYEMMIIYCMYDSFLYKNFI